MQPVIRYCASCRRHFDLKSTTAMVRSMCDFCLNDSLCHEMPAHDLPRSPGVNAMLVRKSTQWR